VRAAAFVTLGKSARQQQDDDEEEEMFAGGGGGRAPQRGKGVPEAAMLMLECLERVCTIALLPMPLTCTPRTHARHARTHGRNID
jgi:hypothetical protein